MAKEKQEQEPKLNIDGKEYKISDLSDGAKGQLQGLQAAETEMKRLNIQLALIQTARNAYMHALQDELPASK